MPAGFGGIEVHGADALMRSVVTLPPLRGRGIGQAIVRALEAEAIVMKCRAVWLLTTTRASFFGKLGYTAVDRADVAGRDPRDRAVRLALPGQRDRDGQAPLSPPINRHCVDPPEYGTASRARGL